LMVVAVSAASVNEDTNSNTDWLHIGFKMKGNIS